jgi:four helix bundle protein
VPTIKHFEYLYVWQSARELMRMIYEDSRQMEFGQDLGLKDQVRRAVVSVMSNIAEGSNAGSDAEFVRFLPQNIHSTSPTSQICRICPTCQICRTCKTYETYQT